jgi:hypothetical protein
MGRATVGTGEGERELPCASLLLKHESVFNAPTGLNEGEKRMTKRSDKNTSKKRPPRLKKEVVKDLDAKNHSAVKGGGGNKPQTQLCTPPPPIG